MKKIVDLYYTLWVDCITRIRNFDSFWWEYKSMLIINFWLGSCFFIFMSVIQNDILGGIYFYQVIDTNNSRSSIIGLCQMFILYFLPFILINYFLIFYKKKYILLIEKYEYKNGKYIFYFFGFFVFLILGWFTFLFLL